MASKRRRPSPNSNPRTPSLGTGPPQPANSSASAVLQQATSLHSNGDLTGASRLYREALRLQPRNFDATHMLGVIGLQTARYDEAFDLIGQALRLNPNDPRALANMASACLYLGQHADTVRYLDQALRLAPQFAGGWNNRGNALQRMSQHDAAAHSFEKLLQLAPTFEFALGNLCQSRRHGCNWRDFDRLCGDIRSALIDGERADKPFSFLSVSDSAMEQRRCAEVYAGSLCPTIFPPLWTGERYGHDRIRIAYVSADFRSHVVANVMAALYEHHDRDKFTTIGISLTAGDDSEVAQRAKGALEEFVDATHLSDDATARLMREAEIDIAVDLTGFTQGCRPGIFARRPAPAQVNFLGMPATMGVPYIDYIIADDFVIPPSLESAYSERPVRLPDSFQLNDDRRSSLGPLSPPPRAQLGLPADALVLCCFNNTYKLNPTLFDVWARILHHVPNSMLWLVAGEESAQARLREEAAARAIEPRRLVFAERVPYHEHLARLAAADLFLDTLPFNGGATASDALWAGVPVLTCAGEAFAARMAGSLLTAAGLHELITFNMADYEQRALEITSNPTRLAALRQQLTSRTSSAALFDTARYCRNLEAAYTAMWERTARGAPPAPITAGAHPG